MPRSATLGEPDDVSQAAQQRPIRIRGARVHNLKNIDLELPRNAFPVRLKRSTDCGNYVRVELTGALDLVASRFEFEHKRLVRDYPKKLSTVWCDSDQLQQVFVNICINALEATNAGGTLTVTAKTNRRNKTVTLRFADTGSGMTAEDIERAFDPFYTTKDTGTGLGLAICHSIVEDHSGTIQISSKN